MAEYLRNQTVARRHAAGQCQVRQHQAEQPDHAEHARAAAIEARQPAHERERGEQNEQQINGGTRAHRGDERHALGGIRHHAARFGIERLNVPRSDIPAVTHIDYSARVQTVRREDNPAFHALLTAFDGLTGCPVLVNTSFNVRGEPIVCRPEEAFACFMRTDMDHLVMGSFLLDKSAQAKTEDNKEWMKEFALD